MFYHSRPLLLLMTLLLTPQKTCLVPSSVSRIPRVLTQDSTFGFCSLQRLQTITSHGVPHLWGLMGEHSINPHELQHKHYDSKAMFSNVQTHIPSYRCTLCFIFSEHPSLRWLSISMMFLSIVASCAMLDAIFHELLRHHQSTTLTQMEKKEKLKKKKTKKKKKKLPVK